MVKSAKSNGGKKPILKKLSARLDRYDAWIDLENQTVIVKLRSRVFKIKLLHRRNYIRKFFGHKWYEVIISIDKSGKIWVNIPFRWIYRPYRPRKLISLDMNLRKIVIYNGKKIRRINTRFTEALCFKHLAENI